MTFLIFSCKKESRIDACDQRFYYYSNDKIFLTELNDKLTISFPLNTTAQEKRDLISQFSFLGAIETSVEGPKNNFVLTSFKGSRSCQEAKNRIIEIQNNTLVSSASLMLVYKNDQSLQGLVGQFLVKLKPITTKQDLDSLASLTNTKILYRSAFDTLLYTLGADKHSNGDVLDMANWFFETGKFQYSEPNFVRTTLR